MNTEVVRCGQCGGRGRTVLDFKDNQQCPGCGGSGYVRVGRPSIMCGQCGGGGTTVLNGKDHQQCPGCDGSGWFRG